MQSASLASALLFQMRADERGNFVGPLKGESVSSAAQDGQAGSRDPFGKKPPDRQRTDRIGITPYEQGRRADLREAFCKIRLVLEKPFRQSWKRGDILGTPIGRAEDMCCP